MVQEFEIVTSLYTLVPWLSGVFIILGLLLVISSSVILGWYGGHKAAKNNKINLWFAFGWIPIFALFIGSVFISSVIYYSAMDELKTQIKTNTGLDVVTFVRGDEKSFVTVDDKSNLMRCRVGDKEIIGNTYSVRCK